MNMRNLHKYEKTMDLGNTEDNKVTTADEQLDYTENIYEEIHDYLE